MIVELLLRPLFLLINSLISLLPRGISLPAWSSDAIAVLSSAMFFFPLDVWIVFIANVSFWLSAQFGWAVIEWVYKKIPGVS